MKPYIHLAGRDSEEIMFIYSVHIMLLYIYVSHFNFNYTLSGRIGKVVASHAEVARSISAVAEIAPS